eukprot:gene16945-23819_t
MLLSAAPILLLAAASATSAASAACETPNPETAICPACKPAVDVLIVFDRSRSSYAVTEPPGGCAGEPQCIGGTKKLFDVLKTTKDLVVEELVAMFSSDGVAPFLETRDIRFAAASFSSDVTVDFDFDADLSHLQTVDEINNICEGPSPGTSCA